MDGTRGRVFRDGRSRLVASLAAHARSPIVLALLAVLSCSSGDTTAVDLTLAPTDANVTGTFSLVRAGGVAPPFQALVTALEIWNLETDRMSILADQTWVDTATYNVISRLDGTSGPRVTASAGIYGLVNNQIAFTMKVGGSSSFVGSVTSNALTINFNGRQYLYSR